MKELILTFILLFLVSCEHRLLDYDSIDSPYMKEKEFLQDYDVKGSWQVISVDFFEYENQYILNIKADNTFKIDLDVNTYVGKVSYSQGLISFYEIIGTKACCDSPESTMIIDGLKGAVTYSINRDILTIEGSQTLSLKNIY